jgi:hypothetical protein
MRIDPEGLQGLNSVQGTVNEGSAEAASILSRDIFTQG